MACDVRSAEATEVALKQVEADRRFVGVVVPTPVWLLTPFPAMTISQWREVTQTSLDGFFNGPASGDAHGAPALGAYHRDDLDIRLGGEPWPGQLRCRKSGLIGAVKSLSQELAKRQITVNAVAPG